MVSQLVHGLYFPQLVLTFVLENTATRITPEIDLPIRLCQVVPRIMNMMDSTGDELESSSNGYVNRVTAAPLFVDFRAK